MPLEKEKPPTHTAWSQFRERGQFRQWYERGPGWVQRIFNGPGPHGAKDDLDTCPHCGGKLPPISGKIFHAMHGPRGDDGFTYFFPIGMKPEVPVPPEAKRPGASQSAAEGDEI